MFSDQILASASEKYSSLAGSISFLPLRS